MKLSNVTGVQHMGVPSSDLKQTIAFFESLGFEVARRDETPSGVPVAFLKLGSCVIETYEDGPVAGHPGAIDHISLDVTDVDTVFPAVKAEGHKMLHDSVQSLPFWEKGVRFFTIEGPDAVKIEFCEILK